MLYNFFLVLDAWLIAPFRWPASPLVGFFWGSVFLAVQSVAVGHLCLLGMMAVQRPVRSKYDAEAAKRSDLAVQALQVQDKTAYLAQNRLAKDAFGRSMALAVGRMTATLWPAVAGLAWMDLRFRGVPLELPFTLPGVGNTVYYPFFFIPLYIVLRLIWARIWPNLRLGKAQDKKKLSG